MLLKTKIKQEGKKMGNIAKLAVLVAVLVLEGMTKEEK